MNQITLVYETNDDLLIAGSIGLCSFTTAVDALEAAEKICYEANRLTAPISGIETRNIVFAASEDSFKSVTFPIKTDLCSHRSMS